MGTGANADAVCSVEVRGAEPATGFGAGVDPSIVTASLKAGVSGINRHLQAQRSANEAQAEAA